MSNSAVQIRLANSEDESVIRACVAAAYEPYLARMDTAPAPMLDDYAALIERGVVHVATLEDEVVGLIVMWPKDDHLYVDNIAVLPSAAGRGIGTALLAVADTAACETDQQEVRLYTNEAMAENLSYYPRRGFVETHRSIESGYRRVYFSRGSAPN